MVKALVLAAGMGSRIRAVAGDLPKPLMRIAGRPILAHNLRWLANAGVREAWINLHYGADLVREAIGDGSAFGLKVTYVHEPQLLGTAGALANLGAVFDDTMLVVYGDSLVKLDVAALLSAHAASRAEITLALFDRDLHPHTGIAGGRVQVNAGGFVTAMVEGAGSGPGLVNAGVYAADPSILDLIPRGQAVDFGHDVFPAMRTAGRRMGAYLMDKHAYCLGLDTPQSLATGEALIAEGVVVP
jgi:mannose-1-phosphate guanylyltransferase